jgi:hypothetical protein
MRAFLLVVLTGYSTCVFAADTYRSLGNGECMDSRNTRVDHCFDRGLYVKSFEECQKNLQQHEDMRRD